MTGWPMRRAWRYRTHARAAFFVLRPWTVRRLSGFLDRLCDPRLELELVAEIKPLKYRAFLSHSHRDTRWAKWLQFEYRRAGGCAEHYAELAVELVRQNLIS